MRQGLSILSVATLEAVLAALLDPPLAWVIAYVSLGTGLAGLCSMAGWPHLLGKRADGTLPMWSLLVFWPWHLLVRSIVTARRHLVDEPLTQEIHPGWFLGGWPFSADLWEEWPAVIDTTCEMPRRGPPTHYLCLPTWDATAPSREAFDRAVAFARDHRAQGRPVLVHCAAGHGRSATVLAAALVDAGLHATWQEAVAHMQGIRPGVRLGVEQQQAVGRWSSERG